MKVAILGATGAVGRTMLQVLEERDLAIDELVLLASERSSGQTITWRGRTWPISAPSKGSFTGCDIALFSAGASRSREWGPVAAAEGAVVIDNSSAWRMDPDVPLVVPEVNAGAMENRPRGIIANPNCAVIQLAVALAAVRRMAPLKRVIATTFQSVSGAGNKGIATLHAELAGNEATESPFVATIAGNVIPYIGPRGANGWNEEEVKVREEAKKILGMPDLAVTATCVRVPVEVGHSVSAVVELEHELSVADVHAALRRHPGIEVFEGEQDPLPKHAAGIDGVRVGRVRVDPDDARVIHLWIVADNLRKGAATNAVQIAELLMSARVRAAV